MDSGAKDQRITGVKRTRGDDDVDKSDLRPGRSSAGSVQSEQTPNPPAGRNARANQASQWVHKDMAKYLDPAKFKKAANVQAGIRATKKLRPDISKIRVKERNGPRDLTLRLWKLDTLEAADRLRTIYADDRIAVLNMANPRVPGGGLLSGSIAQEEALCMRTTLYRSLSASFFPLRIPDVIYSPDMLVCKAFDGSWWGADLKDDETYFVNVISAAAVARPNLTTDSQTGLETYADPRDRQAVVDGVESILMAALENNIQALVLGAWGCGMFGNPIHEVASIMREAILGVGSRLPPHNWAGLGLVEIVIAIYDTNQASGYPVWNGFLDEFREDELFRVFYEPIDTTESCHVLQWPINDEDEDSGGTVSTPTTAPSVGHPPKDRKDGDDDDSLFGDSDDEGLNEANLEKLRHDELAKAAAGYLFEITGNMPARMPRAFPAAAPPYPLDVLQTPSFIPILQEPVETQHPVGVGFWTLSSQPWLPPTPPASDSLPDYEDFDWSD